MVMAMSVGWHKQAVDQLGNERILLDMESRIRLSKDNFWYSPVLQKQLKDKIADGVVIAHNEDDIILLLKLAYQERIPVTLRGAGTGNYGQSVPLHGGIVLDVSLMDQILEIGDGYARVQPGVRLGVLEKKAREVGQELRIYPSTFMKATVGGFVCGGTGGIGSITWGNLWDGNVNELSVLTAEKEPRKLIVKGDALFDYIHNYGTTGVVTEIVIPLARRTEWQQLIFSFPHYADALLFADSVAKDNAVKKRLISPMEWPIPSFFFPLGKVIVPGKAVVFVEISDSSLTDAYTHARRHKGEISHFIKAEQYRKGIGLSDFTWNHTTLWASKADPKYTYLQAEFLNSRYLEQAARIKSEFGDEVLLHHEWVRSRGNIVPQSLPLVRFSDEERLYEIIAYCQSIGISIFDPHTYLLESGGRGAIQSMIARKRENDPYGLLNPGKIQYL
jgi:FAD/FMN-containing dehydrogenase